MPTYIFKNTKTDEIFEQQMRISELDEFKSKNPDLVQMPTAPSFRLKGTGWYETDFKTGDKKNIAGERSDSAGKPDGKSETASSTGDGKKSAEAQPKSTPKTDTSSKAS